MSSKMMKFDSIQTPIKSTMLSCFRAEAVLASFKNSILLSRFFKVLIATTISTRPCLFIQNFISILSKILLSWLYSNLFQIKSGKNLVTSQSKYTVLHEEVLGRYWILLFELFGLPEIIEDLAKFTKVTYFWWFLSYFHGPKKICIGSALMSVQNFFGSK